MSDPLRIALVGEGPVDTTVIRAAISRILDGRPFISTQLQPEGSIGFGPTGTGWGGVFRWCRQSAARGGGSLSGDPLFATYDVLVLHIDADVADRTYTSANIYDGFNDLPCAEPCPPASATTDALRIVLLRWCGEDRVPPKTVLCIPSKSTEAWVLAALFPRDKIVQSGGLECLGSPKTRLAQKPKPQRLKDQADYEKRRRDIELAWTRVTNICAEAQRFTEDFLNAVAPRLNAIRPETSN